MLGRNSTVHADQFEKFAGTWHGQGSGSGSAPAGGRQRANTQAGSSSSKQLVFCIAGLLLAWLSTSCGIEEGVAGLARPVARARSCTAGASGATRRLGPVSPSRQQCSIL